MKNFVEELRWRGLLHNMIPRTEEKLLSGSCTAYIGFDPTADSLHIGSLLPIILLKHFQNSGHSPIALLGGATGRIGDPSGKSDERNLLDEETLQNNIEGIREQLSRFLDFDTNTPNHAKLVDNMDWMRDFTFIDFAREVGKRITVNYMMSKDSVKNRLSADSKAGMSFTEFTYQLLQGYDFYHLHKNYDCHVQMGGSDQWGNITTGTELIRKMYDGEEVEAFAVTCPLVTKSDGSKFGKTEGGNIWLDSKKTSPYKFYQFWLNTSDKDAAQYIKYFTFLNAEEIEEIQSNHLEAPHERLLQKMLAKEVTTLVHGEVELEKAILASQILFGSSTQEDLQKLDEETFLSVFDGVPQKQISMTDLESGIGIIPLFSSASGFLSSGSEARRALKENSLSVNKEKIKEEIIIDTKNLISGKFILLQRGKKRKFILVVTP